jgi:DNA polymerase-3 subunit alpha
VFSEAFDRFRDYLVKDTLLVAEGNLSYDDFAGQLRLSAEKLMSIEQARVAFAKRLTLRWPDSAPRGAEGVDELRQMVMPFRGGNCPVYIEYRTQSAESLILLGEEWQVAPVEELLDQLEQSMGPDRVQLQYQ